MSAVPKKTQQDTQYCVRLWEEWCQHRQSNFGVSIQRDRDRGREKKVVWDSNMVRKKTTAIGTGTKTRPDR